jgi:hypothetical protein
MASFTDDALTIKSDTSITQNNKQSVIYILDLNLSNIDQDGVMEFSCNISSLLFNAILNGQAFGYQSGNTKDTASMKKYAEYSSLVDNPFSVRIGKNGGILEIFRVDKIMSKYLLLKDAALSATNAQKEGLRNSISEGELKPLLNQIFREMPSSSIKKDTSWSSPQPPAPFLIFKLANTNLFKLAGFEKLGNDTVAVINAGLKSVVLGDTKYEERGAKFEFKKPQPTASGTIYFNLTKGCIQKSNIKTQINIFYTMQAPSPKGIQKGSKNEVINNTNVLELL